MQRQQFRDDTETTTPLYDAEAVRQVLARVSEVELQAEPGDLTPKQVEALGAELGLSPQAVHRALGERVAAPSRPSHLTVAQIIATPLPGFALALLFANLFYYFSPFLIDTPRWITSVLFSSVLIVPTLLSTLIGYQWRDRRVATMTGFFLCTFAIFAPMVGVGLKTGEWGYGAPLVSFTVASVIGVALG